MSDKDSPPDRTYQDPEADDMSSEDNNFWVQIMAECEANAPNRLPSSKSVLILGDNDAQKSQLVAKLQGTGEKWRKGNGLEYFFLNVRDEYCESHTKLNVWVLDDDPSFQALLKYVLNEDTLCNTTVVLIVTMTKPWDMFRCICTWVEILESHIKGLCVPSSVIDEQRAKVLKRYQEYVEPTASIYGTLDEHPSSADIERNLGVEVMVVVTQTEYMSTLQNEFGYVDEHFDFVQLSLRKFCLTYGAALFYVSVKEDRNCDILLKYILHKIYSFPFRIPAMFLERDSIFVPAGWDTENKILALAESLATITFSSPFEDVIVKPSRLSDNTRLATEIEAQRDQDFLASLQATLARQPSDAALESGRELSLSGTGTPNYQPRRTPRAPRSPQKKQLESKISNGDGDTVLQSFFKSLLKRQTSMPAERPPGLTANRGQTSANLDRSTSLDDDSTAKSGLDSRRFGSSVDSSSQTRETENLTTVDELTTLDDISKALEKELGMSSGSDPFSEFLNKIKAGDVDPDAISRQESKEENDANVHQLPEYFMSSQSSSCCPTDCCYRDGAPPPSNGNVDHEMLDRVSSKFNPPLKLLLEPAHEACKKKTKGGCAKKTREVQVEVHRQKSDEKSPETVKSPPHSTANNN